MPSTEIADRSGMEANVKSQGSTSPAVECRPNDHEEAIRREQVMMLYTGSRLSPIGNIVFALVLVLLCLNVVPVVAAMIWLGYVVVVSAGRMILFDSFEKGKLGSWSTHNLLREFTFSSDFNALAWGAVPLIFFPEGMLEYQLLGVITACAVISTATVSLSSFFPVAVRFVLLVLIPIPIRLFIEGGTFHIALAAALVLFGFFVLRSTAQQFRVTRLALERHFSARDEIARLSDEREVLQGRCRELEGKLSAAAMRHQSSGAFLTRINHELRSLSSGIVGLSEVMGEEARETKLQNSVELLKGSAERLLYAVDELFDQARVHGGEVNLIKSPFQLKPVLQTVMTQFNAQCRRKGQQFAYELPDSPEWVLGDRRRLSQLLEQLLDNASKFAPEGGRIAVKAEVGQGVNGSLRLDVAVADNGPGIAPEQVADLLKTFDGIGSAARTGRGLIFCSELARAMGGGLTVESSTGKGSIFRFFLPLEAGHVAEPHEVTAAPEAQGDLRLPPLKVLLAEDNEVNAALAKRVLENGFHSVVHVRDGSTALERARNDRFDLILMECHMPLMDGYDVARSIRSREKEHGKSAHIPIIALTADNFANERERCFAAGMDGYVAKPLRKGELLAEINRVLTRSAPRSP